MQKTCHQREPSDAQRSMHDAEVRDDCHRHRRAVPGHRRRESREGFRLHILEPGTCQRRNFRNLVEGAEEFWLFRALPRRQGHEICRHCAEIAFESNRIESLYAHFAQLCTLSKLQPWLLRIDLNGTGPANHTCATSVTSSTAAADEAFDSAAFESFRELP